MTAALRIAAGATLAMLVACTPTGRDDFRINLNPPGPDDGTNPFGPPPVPYDAGFDEAGVPIDIGMFDFGFVDTGPRPDVGAPPKDAGPPPPDMGGPAPDAGVGNPDASPRDASPPDLGPPDAGVGTGPMPVAPLGPAPGGNSETIASLQIANDQSTARVGETAFSGVPIPQSVNLLDTSGLVIVGPGDQWLQGQFDVVSRWGGPVADTARPVRWLQVSVQASVDPNGSAAYLLRRYPTVTPPADPIAARITGSGNARVVETGVARFTLDGASPALIARIETIAQNGTPTTVYQHAAGAGPKLVLGNRTFSTATPGSVAVDQFTVVETGPVKVVVAVDGHFTGQGTTCPYGGGYEAQAFTIAATFTRGRADVDLELHYTNECGDAFGGPWTDDTINVDEMSFVFPVNVGAGATAHYGGSGGVATANSPNVVVEQRKGGGNPWRRRARVMVGGTAADNAEAYTAPFAALRGSAALASVTMPWMRYREPQAIGIDGSNLFVSLVSENLRVGEAKGIWGFARLGFAAPGADLELTRQANRVATERSLLISTPKSHFNSARIVPSIGSDASSAFKTAYLRSLNDLHDDTIGPQWRDAKTYGTQLWPDTQFDQWGTNNANPGQNSGRMNYWDPAGAELLEFVRSGDPKWVWDFAMPQSWLQMFAAYYNLGDHFQGSRNGVAVTSGGEGEGNWHRSGQGSDDYTYDMGQFLAYALRPTYGMQRRFRQAGRNFQNRYSVGRGNQGNREEFVNEIHVSRQFTQHFEMLANCAEYVRGQAGRDCHTKLQETLTELAEENMRGGVICEGDAPSVNNCSIDQQFMMNALHLPFFHRMYRNYGDISGELKDALVGGAFYLYAYGLSKNGNVAGLGNGMPLASAIALPSRPPLSVGGQWAQRMECSLAAGGAQVQSCGNANDNGIDPGMFDHNKPHTVSALLMAHDVDPAVRLCGVAKAAADQANLVRGWDDFVVANAGWSKGTGQMMQAAIYGVGGYDVCSD